MSEAASGTTGQRPGRWPRRSRLEGCGRGRALPEAREVLHDRLADPACRRQPEHAPVWRVRRRRGLPAVSITAARWDRSPWFSGRNRSPITRHLTAPPFLLAPRDRAAARAGGRVSAFHLDLSHPPAVGVDAQAPCVNNRRASATGRSSSRCLPRQRADAARSPPRRRPDGPSRCAGGGGPRRRTPLHRNDAAGSCREVGGVHSPPWLMTPGSAEPDQRVVVARLAAAPSLPAVHELAFVPKCCGDCGRATRAAASSLSRRRTRRSPRLQLAPRRREASSRAHRVGHGCTLSSPSCAGHRQPSAAAVAGPRGREARCGARPR